MRKYKCSNKGYTLVELLVAMVILVVMLMELYSVMSNSSTLYRKGNYEVQLQTEAQQVILQLEDLMVDCNGSISFNDATKELTISSNVVESGGASIVPMLYTIRYVPAGTGTPSSPFGQLSYQKTGMSTAIPLADYVEDFSVDMSGYTNDNITLNISFANEEYAYTASEDIYLRNEIGSGGHGSADDTSGAKEFLDVKRYQNYKLKDLYKHKEDGYEYVYDDFYFKDESGNKKYETSEYNIDSSTYVLSIKSSYRADHDDEYGPYLIYATGKKKNLLTGDVETLDETNGLLISAHTDKVSWGFNNYSYYYLPAGSTSYAATGLTQFKGISLAGAEKITYTYAVKPMSNYHYDGTVKVIDTDKTEKDGYPSSQGQSSKVIFFADPGQVGNWDFRHDVDNSLKQYQCRIDKLYNYVDATSNAVVCYNGGSVWNYDMCGNFIKDTSGGFLKDGNRFYINVKIDWSSPESHEEFKIYLYPTDRSLSDGEKHNLEEQKN